MGQSCVFRPRKTKGNSTKLFDEIKSHITRFTEKSDNSKAKIYDKTWKAYGLAISSKFKSLFKESLSFDAEGFPTLKSLLDNEYFKALLGKDVVYKSLENNFRVRENTIENYRLSLEAALSFNKDHDNEIALVEVENGKLVTKVYSKNNQNVEEFTRQYASLQLSTQAADMLSELGIGIGEIMGEEASYRNGKIDFSKAKDIVQGIQSLIMAANNMNGALAIGEEFAHLLVGIRRDNPLIQRLIDNLSNNEPALVAILGDKYEAELEAQDFEMKKVAEEALGQLLHRHLIDGKIQETLNNEPSKGFYNSVKTLFNRFRDFILKKFKNKDLGAASDVLAEAQTAMSEIANEMLSGKMKLTKKDIEKSFSNTVLNDLTEQFARNSKVLDEIVKTERKRANISKDADKISEIVKLLNALENGNKPTAESLSALFKYLEYACKELNDLNFNLQNFNTLDTQDKFKVLRNIRSYIKSFEPIVTLLNELKAENAHDSDPNSFTESFEYEGVKVNLSLSLERFGGLVNTLKGQYKRLAIPSFASFLEGYLGTIKDNKGEIVELVKMITEQTGDISIMDRWLDSMADSSDQFLQSMDTVYRKQKDKARAKSLSDIRKIQALQIKAERMGITSFEWMFETYNNGKKTGNYIEEVNYSQFQKDLEDFEAYLDKKYGKRPNNADDRDAKWKERVEWLDKHAIQNFLGSFEANPKLYRNAKYDALSANQKEILEEYKKIKAEYDENFPADKVSHHAIQIRKDTFQRYVDMAKSPSSVFDNIKESWKNALASRADDDLLFGERTKNVLIDFDGRQFNTLPIFYQHKLEDPEELSTDVFSALTAYAISANDYEAIEEILDAMEVGRSIVLDDYRKVQETVGGTPLAENLRVGNQYVKQKIIKGQTAMEDKLNEWFDSQIYKKYFAEETEFSVPFLHKKVKSQKITSILTHMASSTQLAFNFLANVANIGTGIAMINIEAIGGDYFGVKDLAFADKEYGNMLPGFVKELNSRHHQNKMSLFCEMFNVKYNFDNRGRLSQRASAFARIFGKSWGFIGQEGGDHWLYTRIAIAMCHKQKVKVPNSSGGYTTMSLWDALKIEDSEYGEGLKIMQLPKGTLYENGKEFDVGAFSRKIGKVCQRNFGIYNEEDRVMAQRHSLGRMIMMYRQWIKPLFNNRFQSKQYNQTLEDFEEGYYKTIYRLASDLAFGKIALVGAWDSLEGWEKRNIKKAAFEVTQFLIVAALANWVDWPDDKKRPWAMKFAEYMAKREYHELGNLTPSPVMMREMLATVKSPSAVIGVLDSLLSWINSLLSPEDWTTELQSGAWKGHTKFYKKTMKLPIPILQWYHQMDKISDGLDDKINYYVRIQSQ